MPFDDANLDALDLLLGEFEDAGKEPKTDDPTSDISEDDNTPSDGTEEPQVEDSDVEVDTPQDEANDAESSEDIEPIEDRLKAFEDLLGDDTAEALDVSTPKGLMQKLESEAQQLQAELAASPLNNLPQGGVFNHNGKWVFHMSEGEINNYLTELKDNGQEFSAAQVHTAILNALNEVPKFQHRQQALQQRAALIHEQRQIVEWQDFKSEVQRKLPEMTQDDFDKIGNYVDNMTSSDPNYAAIVSTKEGKVLKGVEAAKKLGILQRLKGGTASTITKPSAPDANAASKKVRTGTARNATYKRSEVEAMSQAEFNKLSDTVVDALLRGDNIIDD